MSVFENKLQVSCIEQTLDISRGLRVASSSAWRFRKHIVITRKVNDEDKF
jgi:hypothetical protein